MKTTHLYNTAHPLGASGKPIFIPFGEWKYDGQSRQRLDRAHGEKIANELNARVAKGDPGIPVYQGHPDVPALAAKYPDKGALGWVVRAELANEDGKDGLALTVEWDRDPGRGFRWFSPYWLANGREGSTYVVDSIASIGLVNNPNIPEFRLANEKQHMKINLNPAIIELAAKYDRLANEANFDESKHPRAEDGKFSSGGGGGSGSKESGSEKSSDSQPEAKTRLMKMVKSEAVSVDAGGRPTKDDVVFEYQHKMYFVGKDKENTVQEFVDRGLVKRVRGYHTMFEGDDGRGLSRNAFILKERGAMSSLAKELAARHDRLANEANFDESKHPRSEDGKFTSGGDGGGNDRPDGGFKAEKDRQSIASQAAQTVSRISHLDRTGRAKEINEGLQMFRGRLRGQRHDHWNRLEEYESVRAQHRAAIYLGLTYNPKTHQYE